MKKWIVLGITLVAMIAATVVMFALPVSADEYSGSCSQFNSDILWNLDTGTGVMTFEGEGEMPYYNPIGGVNMDPPWYRYRKNIKAVVIGDGITSIGDYAFYDCTNLKSVELPDSITEIGDGAFLKCASLKSIQIPEGVTLIGWALFEECSQLMDVDIPDSVTHISARAFLRCANLNNIELSDNIKEICASAFEETGYYNNKANWENDVLYINHHLIDAKETITGSYTIKSGTVTIAIQAFGFCEQLTSIEIPKSITSISDSAFLACKGLTDITIPNSITVIGEGAFTGCSGLESVKIPESIKLIESNAFSSCTNLYSIDLPETAIQIGYNAFKNTGAYNSHITNGHGTLYVDNHLILRDDNELTLMKVREGTVTIADSAFDCYSLQSVEIPDGVLRIGEDALRECPKLKKVTILSPNVDIYDSEYTIDDFATIYGYDGSTAEEYAKKYEREFVSLGEYSEPLPPVSDDPNNGGDSDNHRPGGDSDSDDDYWIDENGGQHTDENSDAMQEAKSPIDQSAIIIVVAVLGVALLAAIIWIKRK